MSSDFSKKMYKWKNKPMKIISTPLTIILLEKGKNETHDEKEQWLSCNTDFMVLKA